MMYIWGASYVCICKLIWLRPQLILSFVLSLVSLTYFTGFKVTKHQTKGKEPLYSTIVITGHYAKPAKYTNSVSKAGGPVALLIGNQ